MRFFLDENFPKAAQPILAARGHEVYDVRGTDHEGAEDADLFRMAQGNASVFLTTDRDFFHTVPHLYPDHHGVVVVALRQPNRQDIVDRLLWFLERFGDTALRGRAFLLRDRTYAAYPPEGESGGWLPWPT